MRISGERHGQAFQTSFISRRCASLSAGAPFLLRGTQVLLNRCNSPRCVLELPSLLLQVDLDASLGSTSLRHFIVQQVDRRRSCCRLLAKSFSQLMYFVFRVQLGYADMQLSILCLQPLLQLCVPRKVEARVVVPPLLRAGSCRIGGSSTPTYQA